MGQNYSPHNGTLAQLESVLREVTHNAYDSLTCTRKCLAWSEMLMLHCKVSKLNVEFKVSKMIKIPSFFLHIEISMQVSSRDAGS